MLLYELFENETDLDAGEMTDDLRNAVLDYLTPFMSQNLPFVTIDQVIDALRQGHFGVVINRAMVMDLLDPQTVQAVAKIENDRIYLQSPDADPSREVDGDDAEKDQKHVANMAVDQVKKSLTDANKPS
jgi:hypothetical protein